jgi:hypothetical protein
MKLDGREKTHGFKATTTKIQAFSKQMVYIVKSLYLQDYVKKKHDLHDLLIVWWYCLDKHEHPIALPAILERVWRPQRR